MTESQTTPKDFFGNISDVQALLKGKQIILFLDYDGTLTPIVDTPDLAIISDKMRQTVREAATVMTVSIVSGRATDDVRGKVDIGGIFYAGSHGFEIVTPEGNVIINDEAKAARTVIDAAHADLSERVKSIKGALIEHVKYTISAHYRLVADADFPAFAAEVQAALEKYPSLRRTEGKKVFELRPRIDWDKGKAVNWILEKLSYDPARQIAVYLGDDTTDEDAFRVLREHGMGVLVAEEPRPSAAVYRVRDTAAVEETLRCLMDLTREAKS